MISENISDSWERIEQQYYSCTPEYLNINYYIELSYINIWYINIWYIDHISMHYNDPQNNFTLGKNMENFD